MAVARSALAVGYCGAVVEEASESVGWYCGALSVGAGE